MQLNRNRHEHSRLLTHANAFRFKHTYRCFTCVIRTAVGQPEGV